jgi:hypothetical protein
MPGWSCGFTKTLVPGPGATESRSRCWRGDMRPKQWKQVETNRQLKGK